MSYTCNLYNIAQLYFNIKNAKKKNNPNNKGTLS